MQTFLILHTHDLIQTLKNDESAQLWHRKWSPSDSQELGGNTIRENLRQLDWEALSGAATALPRHRKHFWRLREASACSVQDLKTRGSQKTGQPLCCEGEISWGNNITPKEGEERKKPVEILLVSFKAKFICQKNKDHFIMITEDVKFMSLYSTIDLNRENSLWKIKEKWTEIWLSWKVLTYLSQDLVATEK